MPCAVATRRRRCDAPLRPDVSPARPGPVPTMDLVVAALRGEAPASATAATDPAFEAAIRAIKAPQTPKPAKVRRHRR